MLRLRPCEPEDPIEREVVMLLASCEAYRSSLAARLRRLIDACDEDRLLALLGRLQLVSLIGGRVLELAGREVFPRLAASVDAAMSAARERGQVQALVQHEALDRLTRAGIPASPIKGPDLAERIYGDLGLRPCSDVDILVSPRRLDDAVGIVRTLGYGATAAAAGVESLDGLHRWLDHPAPTMPPVEVHWRAEWYSTRPHVGGLTGAALERSRLDSTGVGRRLDPSDELALLLLVYARDGMVGMRLPADLAAWWDRLGGDVPSGALQRISEADPALAAPLAIAALMCARLVGLPAEELIDLRPARTARGRLVARLADPFLDGSPPVREAHLLVDGLLSSRRTLWPFLRRRVLPPAEYIALTYGARALPRGSTRLRLLQVQHPVRVLAYYAWSIASPPPPPPRRDSRGAA